MKNKLELVMEPRDALPCSLKVFTINGINADETDFGYSTDEDIGEAGEYGCGYRCFRTDLKLAPTAMKKYKLTFEQFVEVAEKLAEVLDVGPCGWCA